MSQIITNHVSTTRKVLFCFTVLIYLQTTAVSSQFRGPSHNTLRKDRDLSNPLLSLPDPKSVLQKIPIEPRAVGEWKYPFNPDTLPRPLHILAFGASVTWGASLDDRFQAFPWLLVGGGPNIDYVDNLSMRASGADYPSLCLESMIPDAQHKNYDLILLEFNINGSNGFHLLMKRLRDRYPEAIIVMVHLWSLSQLVREEETNMRPNKLGLNPEIHWVWLEEEKYHFSQSCVREFCDSAVMEQLVHQAQGYVYKLPIPTTPKIAIDSGWFANDWHHLSESGHIVVANGILEILSKHQPDLFKSKRLGSFGLGDQCYSWFMDGNITVNYAGAELKLLGPTENSEKWVLEFNEFNGGRISFQSKFSFPVPIGISYMSKQEDSNYSIVNVSVNNDPPVKIDPNYNLAYRPFVHISVLSQIGWANPGHNAITVQILESRGHPFRIVGIYLCGVCAKAGNLGHAALNFEE